MKRANILSRQSDFGQRKIDNETMFKSELFKIHRVKEENKQWKKLKDMEKYNRKRRERLEKRENNNLLEETSFIYQNVKQCQISNYTMLFLKICLWLLLFHYILLSQVGISLDLYL